MDPLPEYQQSDASGRSFFQNRLDLKSLPMWAHAALFAIAYFVSAEIGAWLSYQPTNVLIFWPPSGLALAVFVTSGYRDWRFLVPALLVSNLTFDLIHSRPLVPSLLYGFTDCIEPMIGTWLLRKHAGFSIRLQSVKEVLGLSALSGAVAAAIGATLSTALVLPYTGSTAYFDHWATWWSSSTLGVILIAPACLIWTRERLASVKIMEPQRIVEFTLLMASVIIIGLLVFSQQVYFPSSQEYVLLPLLVWSALRFGLPGATIAGALTAFVAAWSISNNPPMHVGTELLSIWKLSYLQTFLGLSQFTVLILAAILTERQRADEETQKYAERLSTLYEIAQAILSVRSQESIARVALGQIRKLIPCKEASITEFDLRARQARVLAIESDGGSVSGKRAVLPVDAFGVENLQRSRIYHINNLQNLPEKDAIMDTMLAENLNSLLRIPLVVQDELIGSLNLGSDRAAAFSADHIEVANEIAVLIAIAMRHARLHEQTIQDAETKAVLLKEVNHRVKNNLSAIIGLLYAESNRLGNDDSAIQRGRTKDLINRIRGLATVHDMLSAAEWKPLRLSELVEQVIRTVLKTTPEGKIIVAQVEPSSALVMPDQAHNLALIVNELTTNTVKYALADRDSIRISVRITTQNHTVRLEFRDNGPGFPESMLREDGRGYRIGFDIIRNIVQRVMHGSIALSNDDGAVAVMEFETQLT